MNDKPILHTNNLELEIAGKIISVDDFELLPDDFLIVEGPNHFGKSTFLKMLADPSNSTYATFTSGSIFADFISDSVPLNSKSFDRTFYSDFHRMVAYVPQDDDFLWSQSIYGSIIEPVKTTIKMAKGEGFSFAEKHKLLNKAKERTNYWLGYLTNDLKLFEHDSRKNDLFASPRLRSIYSCSGGQKKMCQIISAVIKTEVLGCKLVLMDEPLNNLDKENKLFLNNTLSSLQKECHFALVMVTHCHVFKDVNKELSFKRNSAKSGPDRQIVFSKLPDYKFLNCLEDKESK
jgi:ABC-type cobalamin/Fe3+-siderophores transport system ATPase subunit